MDENNLGDLVETEHTFNGNTVYRRDYDDDRRGRALLYVETECDNCGNTYITGINQIVQGTAGCSVQCGLARSGAHEDAESP